MGPIRALFLGMLALGLATTAAFHAGGALDVRDALAAAALRGGAAGSPPGALTTAGLRLGVDVIRLAWASTATFRAMHLAAGFLLSLAAALSAVVAARSTGRSARAALLPGLGAALAVGAATLFGPDLGGPGLRGSPVAGLLLLLAGSAVAWTAPAPRAFWGGLLLGAAVAEHPIVLFLLPGFAGLGLGALLRIPPERSGRFLLRATAGVVVGLGALALPLVPPAGTPVLGTDGAGTIAGALRIWWVDAGRPFWSFVGPARWGAGLADALGTVLRDAGPVGALLGFAGVVLFFSGRSSRLRPFLLAHGLPAIAAITGEFRDETVARALLGWTFLFWMVPTLVALHERWDGDRVPFRSVLAGVAVAAALLFPSAGSLDRSSEADLEWARSTFDPLPPDALLLTSNPVHLVFAADGERPDVGVVYTPRASTLRTAWRPGGAPPPPVPPGRGLQGETLHALATRASASRPVVIDPSVHFDAGARAALLKDRWIERPWGPAFLLEPADVVLDAASAREGMVPWASVDSPWDLPASPLRDGLDGAGFYGRALLQSASTYLDLGFPEEAEQQFLVALSLPGGNRSLAAFGVGQSLAMRHFTRSAIATLEFGLREEDEGAWLASRSLANLYLLARDRTAARREIKRALRLLPPERETERAELRALEERMGREGGVRERRERGGSAGDGTS